MIRPEWADERGPSTGDESVGRTPIKGRIQPDRVRCANAFMQLVSIREGDRQAGRVDAQRLGHPHPGWSAGTRAREGRHHRGRRDVRACGWRSDRRKATQPLPIRVLVGDAAGTTVTPGPGDHPSPRGIPKRRLTSTVRFAPGPCARGGPWGGVLARVNQRQARRRGSLVGGVRPTSEDHRATPLELFFDLVYVFAVNPGHRLHGGRAQRPRRAPGAAATHPGGASPQRHRGACEVFGGNRAVIDGPFADSNRSLLSHRTKAAQKPYT